MKKKYNPNMPSEHYDAQDAEAIRRSSIPAGLVSDALRFDSAEDASIFFARELDYVKAKTYDKEYPEMTALKLFPISHEVNEGAETVTFYSYEKTGYAKLISNYATDLPRADVKGKPSTAQVKSVGDSYGYSMQDMRASRMAGKSLDVRSGEAAKYQNDRLVNKIAWAGDAETGLIGVLSTGNNVPVYTLSTVTKDGANYTDFAHKTAEEILADINGMVKFVAKATKNVEKPDSLVMPSSVYIDLATRKIPDSDTTILEFLQRTSPYVKNFEEAPELESDAGETNPFNAGVLFLYTKDPEKFTIEIPLDFYQYAAQPKGLEVEIPCESRVAGAILYYPMSALIAAGV